MDIKRYYDQGDAHRKLMGDLKPESWAWHLLGFVIPISVLLGNLMSGWWTVAPLILTFVIGPLLDMLLGEADPNRPIPENGMPYEAILVAHGLLNPVILATLCWRAFLDGNVWTTWTAAASTGVAAGISGIIVAHELGHKKPGSKRWWLGRFNLLLCMYAHFTTEHNYNHHRNVATTADPVSAPEGRGLWTHVAQAIVLQYVSTWKIEKKRLAKRKKSDAWIRNPVLIGLILQALLLIGIGYGLGVWVLAVFSIQAAFSIVLLEYVNYIQHYGLRRKEGERQTVMHSWQSEKRWSRWALLELSRHPAHHLKASEPYWKSRPYEGAPTLPSGYFGVFWPSLFPPIWKRWMKSKIPR